MKRSLMRFNTISSVITTAARLTNVAMSSLPLFLRIVHTTEAKIPIAAILKIISTLTFHLTLFVCGVLHSLPSFKFETTPALIGHPSKEGNYYIKSITTPTPTIMQILK